MFNFFTSQRWDQWYLNFFLVYILLEIIGDSKYHNRIPTTVRYVPLAFMIVTQLVPTIGTTYMMWRCYDLMHLMATKTFGKWAFASVIIAQYIERFYLGGRDRSYIAGKCRKIGSLDLSRPSTLGDSILTKDAQDGFDQYLNRNSDMDSASFEMSSSADYLMTSKSSVKVEDAVVDEEDPQTIAVTEEVAMMSWVCVTCGTKNREPRHPNYQPDILFGSVGEYYTRKFAIIKPRRDMPCCKKCLTDADYQPTQASSHLFVHFPNRYQAFNNYPIKATVQPGIKSGAINKTINHIRSFFFGLRDDIDSPLIFNDWRLRKYLPSRFIEVQRQYKRKDEVFEIGEIVECMIQKLEWTRAVVIVSRRNHIYDIQYDSGDILRYVSETSLRQTAEKQIYSYRVELAMLFIVSTSPLCLVAALAVKPGLVMAGILVAAVYLLALRISMFVRYFYFFYSIGLCSVMKLSSFLSLPLILLVVAGGLCLLGSIKFVIVYYFFLAALISSVPILYMMKPSFVLVASTVYLLFAIGGYLIASYIDKLVSIRVGYCLIPIILAVLLIKYIRRCMHTLWDVCLKIRPPKSFYNKRLIS
uniref:Uncharacterized protein n=1 Tax=Chromulina nebulosa TaxID=96789 RepID=A0A7S0SVQ4_9STRA|mmetsp:Transcript_4716/g.4219  ORF Transcript_4716/g.4219 Transcript_4716/m.4219 type:complete len:585 (+) Transcript_4716:344-2098(+)